MPKLQSTAERMLKSLPLQAKKLALVAKVAGAVFTFASPAIAQPPAQVGVEFYVNATSSIGQFRPDVTQNTGGAFVVAWFDGDEDEVIAQRYNSAGIVWRFVSVVGFRNFARKWGSPFSKRAAYTVFYNRIQSKP